MKRTDADRAKRKPAHLLQQNRLTSAGHYAVAGLILAAPLCGLPTSAQADQSHYLNPLIKILMTPFDRSGERIDFVPDDTIEDHVTDGFKLTVDGRYVRASESQDRVTLTVDSITDQTSHSEQILDADNTVQTRAYGLGADQPAGIPAKTVTMADTTQAKTASAWVKSGVHYLDESITAQTISGTFATLSGGVTYPLSDQLTASFGVEYTYGDLDGNQTFSQTMDMNGVEVFGDLIYNLTDTERFLLGVGLDKEWTHNSWNAGYDDYTVNRFHVSVGAETVVPLSEGVTATLGVNHIQYWSHRDQSTWSTGYVDPAVGTAFGHAGASARLTFSYDDSLVYLQADFGAVTNDDSPLNLSNTPWDGSVSIGLSTAIGSAAVLDAQAYASARSDLSVVGARLHLGSGF